MDAYLFLSEKETEMSWRIFLFVSMNRYRDYCPKDNILEAPITSKLRQIEIYL